MKPSPFILSIVLFIFSLDSFSQIGKGLVLDGYNNFFEIKDHHDLDYHGDFSIEFWIQGNCAYNASNEIILSKQWCVYESAYWLGLNEGKISWSYTSAGHCNSPSSYETRDPVIEKNKFTHVAIVHSSSSVTIYIDGKKTPGKYTVGGFERIHNSSEPLRIGTYKSYSGNIGPFFSGMIDELRIWKISLTESQIQGGMNTSLIGNEPGLVLYFDMEDTGQSSGLVLKNKSQLGTSLDAFPVYFSMVTPYLSSVTTYNVNDIDLGPDITTCQLPIKLDATLVNAIEYLWNTGEQTATIDATAVGQYSVQVTSENCKISVDTIEIKKGQADTLFRFESICINDSIEFYGSYVSDSGKYYHTIQASSDCDTLVELNLSVVPELQQIFVIPTCPDSIIEHDRVVLTFGDTTSFVYQAMNGCDSVISFYLEPKVLFGDSIEVECCINDSVFINQEWRFPNEQKDIIYTSHLGCDSIVNTYIKPSNADSTDVSLYSCLNDSIYYRKTYVPINQPTTFSFKNQKGCDSLVTVTVFETDIYLDTLTYNICNNDSIVYQDSALFVGDSVAFWFTSKSGCDSIIYVEVGMLPEFNETMVLYTCDTAPVIYNNLKLPPGTDTSFVFTASNGCDSIVHLKVESVPVARDTIYINVCENEVVTYSDTTLHPGTTTVFDFTNEKGCDSTKVVTTNRLPIYSSSEKLYICPNDSLFYLGKYLYPDSTFIFELTNTLGCDSVVTVSADNSPTHLMFDTLSVCMNDSLFYQNTYLLPDSMYRFTFSNEFGCDSTWIVKVDEVTPKTDSTVYFVCHKDSIEYKDHYLYPNSIQHYIYDGTNGCDSIHTIIVNENPQYQFLPEKIWTCESVFTYEVPTSQISLDLFEQIDSKVVIEPGFVTGYYYDSMGCLSIDSVYVDFVEYAFYVPTAFSPNNDVINECFHPVFPNEHEITEYQLTIYNRWGQVVFNTFDPHECWDGSRKNKDYFNGVYAWVIKLSNTSCAEQKQYKGVVSIIN